MCYSGNTKYDMKPSVAYIKCQDTLFVQGHTLFDLSPVTDHRLTDHHITGDVNIIPDVGMVQDYVVTCCRKYLGHFSNL